MKRIITLTLACFAFCFGTQAQPKPQQTVYYDNGQKALEGRWSYYAEGNYSLQPPLQLLQQFSGGVGRRQHKSEGSDIAFLNNLNLLIRPEGLIKAWYPSGKPIFEVTYVNGVSQGGFRSYYEGGNLLAEGMLDNGMPAGIWTSYDAVGKLMMRGNYVPFTQAELAERWQDMYITVTLSNDHSRRSRLSRSEKKTPKEPTTLLEDSLRLLPYHVLDAFKDADVVTQADSKRDGDFMLIKSKPKDTLYLHYTADVPTGIWHHTGGNNADILYGIEYTKTGHPVALLEGEKRRTSVAQILQAYRRRDSANMLAVYSNGGDPNGIDPGIIDAPPPINVEPNSNPIFKFVEQMPEFDGDLNSWLKKNMRHPPENYEGRAIVSFVVRSDGSVANAELKRSSGRPEMDKEALRLVRSMPKWKPGKQQGKAVNTEFMLPIIFRLD